MQPINLLEISQQLTEYWSPKIVGRVNDQFIKVAKLKGEFCWHSHELEDELFLVLKGELTIQFEHAAIQLREGDSFVVPRGVRHNPLCEHDCWVALIETVSTKHTGDVNTPFTKSIEQQLG